jgi:adenine-specific DNA glycosylase
MVLWAWQLLLVCPQGQPLRGCCALLSQLLLERHSGEVPSSFAELEALPGVGHKTASVVMTQAFG